VAAGAEQQADRLREDRLAGARLAGDRVQARGEAQLRVADEDEILDAEAAQHLHDRTRPRRTRPFAETAAGDEPWPCGIVVLEDEIGPLARAHRPVELLAGLVPTTVSLLRRPTETPPIALERTFL